MSGEDDGLLVACVLDVIIAFLWCRYSLTGGVSTAIFGDGPRTGVCDVMVVCVGDEAFLVDSACKGENFPSEKKNRAITNGSLVKYESYFLVVIRNFKRPHENETCHARLAISFN